MRLPILRGFTHAFMFIFNRPPAATIAAFFVTAFFAVAVTCFTEVMVAASLSARELPEGSVCDSTVACSPRQHAGHNGRKKEGLRGTAFSLC